MKKSILIARPKDQAQEISNHLEKNGFEVFIEPILKVEKIDLKNSPILENLAQKKIQAVILTSNNAAENALTACEILQLGKEIKVFAISKKTAEKFVEANYKNVICSQKKSAQNLLELILLDRDLTAKKTQELLYFCGQSVTLDFKSELEKQGLRIEKIISYKVIEEQNFSEVFLQKIKKSQFDFVLLYSKNSAKHFYYLCQKHNLLEYFHGSKILCLSQKIADVLNEKSFKNSATFAEIPILKKFYD